MEVKCWYIDGTLKTLTIRTWNKDPSESVKNQSSKKCCK